MNLLQLEYFRVIAQMEHMSKAADVLLVSQPSLSKIIAKLEKELGTPLFDRQGRNIQLNAAGEVLLRHTETIMNQMELLQIELEENMQFAENGFTLATDNSMYLINYFRQFMTAWPQARISQRMLSDQQIIQALLTEEIDLGFCQFSCPHPQIAHEVIVEDQFLLMLLNNHPLAGRTSLCFEDIRQQPLVSLPRTAGYDNIVTRIFSQKGCQPNVVFEGSQHMIFKLYFLGKGSIFASRQGIYMSKRNNLPVSPVSTRAYAIDDVNCNSSLALCWKKNRKLPPMAQCFQADIIQNYPRYTNNPLFLSNPIDFSVV